MRKTIPATMFAARDQARLGLLQDWVLQNAVTEIEMSERQFLELRLGAAGRGKTVDHLYGAPPACQRHADGIPEVSRAVRQANPGHDLAPPPVRHSRRNLFVLLIAGGGSLTPCRGG